MTELTTPETFASKALPALTPNPSDIANIQSNIKISDRVEISMFGEGAQRSVTQYVDKILSSVRNQDLGTTGDLLKDIILKSKGLDPASIQNKGFLAGLFSSAEARLERFKANFEDVAGQIDRIGLDLDRHKDTLRRDIAILGDLAEQTKASIIQLDAYIEAGKAFAKNFREVELPKLKAAADAAAATSSGGLLESQRYQDNVQLIDGFEKRVYFLQQARMVGIQQLPQIGIIQAGNETLIESLQATAAHTIPLWKQKMVIALGLNNQQAALSLQQTVTDATNQMLRETSQMMKGSAIQIEEASQRGIIDPETLAVANQDLIETIQNVIRIQEEGRGKRAAAEQQMKQMTTDLRLALTNVQAR